LRIPLAVTTGLMLAAAYPVSGDELVKDFSKGTRAFTLSVEYVRERRNSDINLTYAVAGYGLYVLDNVALEIQGLAYRSYDGEPAPGVGANIVGRWHFVNWDRLSLYADVAGGVLFTGEDFPEGGTPYNFTYRGGPGASWRLNDGLFLMGGMHFQHISNAFIEGRDRNPIFNGFGAYLDLMWTF